MIDVALLRTDPAGLADSFRRRHLDVDVDALVELDERRRAVRTRAEDLRAEQKRSGKRIATLSGTAKQEAIAAAGRLADEYRSALAEADELDAEFETRWVPLPNPAHESVPVGRSEEDNVEISRWGEIPEFGFDSRDHLDLGEALGILDVERGAKVSGSRFAYLKGAAVRIQFALMQYGLEALTGRGFIPMVTPALVREEGLFGTGFFPGARDQVYAAGVSDPDGSIVGDGLYLIGTSEIPLAAYHADEILAAGDLPLRYAGYSTCYRREAGTYGKDTRGIFRLHQFDKLEMFSFAHPDRSWEEHEYLLAREEELVRGLEIPYRVVNVCTGDLGDPAAKKYDIEAWLPGQGTFRELTSCSNTTDFQARRLKIRVRDEDGVRILHTLNGTAIAVGRTLIALLENHQQADGSVLIPEALRPYLGVERIAP